MPRLDQRLSLASTSDDSAWRWGYRAGTMRLLVLIAAFAASMSLGFAGPCSRAVDRMQARIDARLEAAAGSGPTAPVSSGAYLPPPADAALTRRRRKPAWRSVAADDRGRQGGDGACARGRPGRRRARLPARTLHRATREWGL